MRREFDRGLYGRIWLVVALILLALVTVLGLRQGSWRPLLVAAPVIGLGLASALACLWPRRGGHPR